MPDKKISDLTSGSAIGGTEELPIVQGSTTVKTTINAIKTFFDTIYTTTSAVTTTLLGYVKKGTLTTNYIPKATASDTIGDSQIFDDGTNVGIGTIAPTATIHGKGIDATSSNYALKVDNSASSPLLYVRNDGKVGVNISSPLLTFSVKATANLDGIILQEDASNYYAAFQKDGTRGFLVLYDGNTSKVIFNSPSYSSCDFINTSYNLAIGLNAASAKVHIYGVDSTSSNYALKIDNSSFSPLLYVRNDGLINIGGLTPSQIVETDASKNLVSAAKGTAYNKNFGTSSGTVTEGGTTVLKTGDSLSGALNEAKGTDIASASTTNIGAATGNYIHITGTTTITAFDTVQAGTSRTLVFDGALTLTHNATSLILPGAANITTVAGDVAIFRSEGSGNWRCVSYTTASDSYTNYTPTFTGFSAAPTINTGDARWKMISRNTCHVIIYPSAVGTSNLNSLTVTLPFVSANIGSFGQAFSVPTYNNSAATLGSLRTRVNSNIADVYNGALGTTFTASGTKGVFVSIVYQIEL